MMGRERIVDAFNLEKDKAYYILKCHTKRKIFSLNFKTKRVRVPFKFKAYLQHTNKRHSKEI